MKTVLGTFLYICLFSPVVRAQDFDIDEMKKAWQSRGNRLESVIVTSDERRKRIDYWKYLETESGEAVEK